MFFKEIQIQNFRGIKDMTLQFSPGINLLIGDNGVGKTSVLDAISVALGGFLFDIPNVSTKWINMEDIRIETKSIAGASASIKYMTPTVIRCEMEVDGKIFDWSRIRESESSKSITLSNRKIGKYVAELANDSTSRLPLISYMSAMRISRPKGESHDDFSKKPNDRRYGYMGCLDDTLNPNIIKEWCLNMEMEVFFQERPMPEYELFKNLVSKVMQRMSDLESPPFVGISKKLRDVVYSEDGNRLPISYLSAGYQSFLWMIMNFAYRFALLNPGQSDYRQATGAVLIDEIDLHLHPKWQWNVLNALEEVFPNVQFIIATHSPIIISSLKNGQLINLDSEQTVSYLEDAFAYSITDVLELRQGSLGVPKEIRKLSNQFQDALNLGDYSRAQGILRDMRGKYGDDNSEVKSAMLDLELEELDSLE